jgi:hypothetical protein
MKTSTAILGNRLPSFCGGLLAYSEEHRDADKP